MDPFFQLQMKPPLPIGFMKFKDTLVRQPAEVARSWIFRSLRGPPAETVESMGQYVSLQTP